MNAENLSVILALYASFIFPFLSFPMHETLHQKCSNVKYEKQYKMKIGIQCNVISEREIEPKQKKLHRFVCKLCNGCSEITA